MEQRTSRFVQSLESTRLRWLTCFPRRRCRCPPFIDKRRLQFDSTVCRRDVGGQRGSDGGLWLRRTDSKGLAERTRGGLSTSLHRSTASLVSLIFSGEYPRRGCCDFPSDGEGESIRAEPRLLSPGPSSADSPLASFTALPPSCSAAPLIPPPCRAVVERLLRPSRMQRSLSCCLAFRRCSTT